MKVAAKPCSDPIPFGLHRPPALLRTLGTIAAQSTHGASGLPVVPDECRTVPGSPPCKCRSPSWGPIKRACSLSCFSLLVKHSALWASLAEGVGYTHTESVLLPLAVCEGQRSGLF